MNNLEQTHSGLELSKFLHEAGFEGESEYNYEIFSLSHPSIKVVAFREEALDEMVFLVKKGEHCQYFMDWKENEPDDYMDMFKYIPAYDIVKDLCNKYGKELFGNMQQQGGVVWRNHSSIVDGMMKQGMKDEAEAYIISNCILNPNHK